ncbi:hypothetical protein, partial [Mycobacteroides abscessus]|uniref:hypothetical protein n=1 Tax=Mycobacteroides abscessus TaxID=36809 RepID=UPI00210215DB
IPPASGPWVDVPSYERQQRLLPSQHPVFGAAWQSLAWTVTSPVNTMKPTSANLPAQRIGHRL